jgi:hypothetical protein
MTVAGITTNAEQRLFVIPAGKGGYSCFGFDNCFETARALAQTLDRSDLSPAEGEIGTLRQYGQYRELVSAIGDRDIGTWFDPGTPEQVRKVLEDARHRQNRIRLHYGDRNAGRSWLEENDVIGTIGRSMGPLKAPLLIENARSTGGPAILTAWLVRIQDVATRQDLYRHVSYHLPELEIRPCSIGNLKAEVTADGEVQARFPSADKASRFVSFLCGERMNR